MSMLMTILAMLMTGCVTSRTPDCVGYRINLKKDKENRSVAYSFVRSTNIAVNKGFDPMSSTPAVAGGWVGPQTDIAALTQFNAVFEPATKSLTPTVDRTGGSCDIMLSIHQQNAYNPLVVIPAALSGFTWSIIPCWGDDVYYLNVVAANNRTGEKKEYLISRKVSTTVWLPFIFAAPFGEMPTTARDHITMENWKELRCKLEDDGFFDVDKEEKERGIDIENTSSAVDDAVKTFSNLRKLREQGVISDEEYKKAIERIK